MAQSEGHLFSDSFFKCRPHVLPPFRGLQPRRIKEVDVDLVLNRPLWNIRLLLSLFWKKMQMTHSLTFVEVFLYFYSLLFIWERAGQAVLFNFIYFLAWNCISVFALRPDGGNFMAGVGSYMHTDFSKSPQIKCKWAENLRAQTEWGTVWVSGSCWKTAARHPLFADWTPVAVMIQHICGL